MNIWEIIGFTLLKIVIILSVMLLTVSYLVYFERRISAWAQNRLGPNRVGWEGVLQPFADVLKLLLKEDIVPTQANKKIHTLAPIIALFVAFTTYAVIPIGPAVEIFGYTIPLVVADVNMGILYVLALTSLGVYAITFAGWSSGSKYSLLGGIRSSAQMISYEISMGFSIGGVLLMAESLRPIAIVETQGQWLWNAWIQPIGFITFVVSAFAETNRLPFDLPEAEPELVGGFHTEYSSMKFAMYMLSEYANMVTVSALATIMFLGGWSGPVFGPELLQLALPTVWFVLKISVFIFFYVLLRSTVPRFRYDQLMNFGWKVLLPLALANILITSFIVAIS